MSAVAARPVDEPCADAPCAGDRGPGRARRAGAAGSGALRLPDGAAGDDPGAQRRGSRRRIRRPGELRPVRPDAGAGAVHAKHARLRAADDGGHGPAGLRLRLRDPAQPHPVQGDLAQPRDDPDPGAVAARGDLVHLPVRQPGRVQVHARVGRAEVDLRHAGHGAGDDLCVVPARGHDPDGGTRAVRCAPVRGRRCARHQRAPQVLHDHAAGREVRPDLRLHGGVHDGGIRVRRAQGHRRQHQRAGGRHLQAGDRPAELRDGRGRRPRPAAAGSRRLRHRQPDAAAPAGAADRAQRALPGASGGAARWAAAGVRGRHRGAAAAGRRHGGVRLGREFLALQPVVDA